MDIIKAGIGIGKTIRNVNRMREIVLIFARHGFDEFISGGITSKIPDFVVPKSRRGIKQELKQQQIKDWPQTIGFRLRQCFEELGPAFIKFGQLLSTREDVFDHGFIQEMRLLRDKVRPIPFSEIEADVERSLGVPLSTVFQSIEGEPIGTASIGVVYRGALKDGTPIVIKARRPHIEKEIATDFSIMLFLTQQVEKISDEIRYLGISRIVQDFAVSLQNELNFNIEALNCQRLKKNIQSHDKENIFYLPHVYLEYSSESIIVMEEIKGIPFSDTARLAPHIEEVRPKLIYGVELFTKTFLKDGFFHADLHGGNFFFQPDGKIGLIDFGLVGSLSKKSRKSFIAIIYSIISYNYENLVYEFLDVAQYDEVPDVNALISDVRDALSPFVGLTIQQTNFSHVLLAVIQTLKNHQLHLPREWFIVFRSLITLDGVGKSIDIDLDLFALFEKDIQEIIQGAFSKDELIEEGVWAGRDFISLARLLPRHLKWFLREWSKKGYAVEIIHRGHESSFTLVANSIIFLGFCVISTVLFWSGVNFIPSGFISHWSEIPFLTWVFWALGSFFMVLASLRLKKNRT